MKIILTDSTKKNFLKICNELDLLIKKIKSVLFKKGIYIKRPYLKIKINLCNKALRLVWKYEKDIWIFLLIVILEKKNKNLWENIRWDTINKTILLNMQKIEKELNDWKYKVF